MSLAELLKRTRVDKTTDNSYHTHVSMVKPRGCFHIEVGELELFWQLYNLTRKDRITVGIAEKPQNYTGVVIDVDLYQEITPSDDITNVSLYMPEDIYTTLKLLTNNLRDDLDIKDERVLTSIVLEKPGYIRGTQYRNGYHLQFPFLFVEKEWLSKTFLPKIKEFLPELDTQSPTVAWLLYGSVKSEGTNPYAITAVYDGDLQTLNINTLADYPLFDSYGHAIVCNKSNITMHLPRILSIIPMYRKVTEIKKMYVSVLANRPPMPRNINDVPLDQRSQETIEIAERLVSMLGDHRAADYLTWMRVGWILYYHSGGADAGLRIWTAFSQKCPEKFCEANVISVWNKMTIRYGLTIGTLFYMAMEDSPMQCAAYKLERKEKVVGSYVATSHYGIAKYLHQHYGHEFVCTNIKANVWYQCVRGRWIKLGDPYTLRQRLSEEVARDFNLMQVSIVKTANRNIHRSDEELERRQKLVKQLVNGLRSRPFKMNIVAEAADHFYEPNFLAKLDANKYLIAFQNGVYDLLTNTFRNFLPEDHINKQLPIEYVEFKPTDVAYLKLLDFLSKIFPDPDIRTYFLDIYCEIFVGGNPLKQIYFWTGFGDNGKSVTQTLFEKVLGNHGIKISTTLFTGRKPGTGTAMPELSRAAPPVRLITLEEPDSKEVLNIGLLKQLCGNDTFWARDLYKTGEETTEIDPFFKINFICNRLPKLNDADEATFNRIRVIPFESTFKPLKKCPELEREQIAKKVFPRNIRFNDELNSLATVFAYYLLEWRAHKTTTGIIEPIKVTTATTNYRERNDVYFQFIKEMLNDNPAPTAQMLSEREMFDLFKLWVKNRRNNSNIVPEYAEFIRYLECRWGDVHSDWPNVAQVCVQEQIQTGRLILAGACV